MIITAAEGGKEQVGDVDSAQGRMYDMIAQWILVIQFTLKLMHRISCYYSSENNNLTSVCIVR